MVGTSKRGMQDEPRAVNPDDDPYHATKEHRTEVCKISENRFTCYCSFFCLTGFHVYVFSFQGLSSAALIGYKRRRSKAIVVRGKHPRDIDSNASLSGDADNAPDKSPVVDQPPNPKRQKTGANELMQSCLILLKQLPKNVVLVANPTHKHSC